MGPAGGAPAAERQSAQIERVSSIFHRGALDLKSGQKMSPSVVPVFLAVGMVSISSAAILVRLCDDAPAAVTAAARLCIATLVLLPLLAVMRGPRILRVPRHLIGPILLGGVFLAAHFFFWMTSLWHTSVMSSVVIVTTNPIFVGIGSLLFFKEKMHRNLIFGILLAGIGGLVINFAGGAEGSSTDSSYGNLLALCGAWTASGYLLVGRRVRRELDNLSYMLAVYGIAGLILLGFCALKGYSAMGYRPATYGWFVLLAVVPQLFGHGSLNYALQHVSATMVAVCILAEPIGASILAMIFLKETPGVLQVAGGLIILAGIYLASRRPVGGQPAEIID